MSNPVSIDLENISLLLPVRRGSKTRGLPKSDEQWVGGKLARGRMRAMTVTALNGVTVQIRQGDRVGLIGHNGAGKSSLLRVIAGIYYPSTGRCTVQGKVSTLFTKFLGLNANATGLENIVLSGLTLGLSRREIDRLMPEIIEFSELGEYLNMPVRTYSSGMRTRLGFSVATSAHADILLIDEVFGAGDRRFKRKAKTRMENLIGGSGTMLMASHADEMILTYCNKALWMEHGHLRAFGDVEPVLEAFNLKLDAEFAAVP